MTTHVEDLDEHVDRGAPRVEDLDERVERGAPHAEDMDERVDRVTRVLRLVGSLLLVASLSAFMMQRWDGQSDVVKFLFILAHTEMALLLGLLCGATLRASRAARTFLLLSVALVPMNYALTSGFVYSRFPLDGALHELPQFASWITPSSFVAVTLLALTVCVTTLSSAIATTPLIRGRVGAYLGCSVLANTLVLVPLRSPDFVGLLALIAMGVALSFELSYARNDSRLRTPEGRMLRAVLWFPAAIIVVRSAVFYGVSSFLVAPPVMALGAYLFVASRRPWEKTYQGLLEASGALLAAMSWLPIAFEIDARLLPSHAFHPLMVLPTSLVLVVFGAYAKHTNSFLRSLAAGLALAVCVTAVFQQPSMVSGLLTIATGVFVACYGMLASSRVVEIPAMAVCALGLICCVSRAIGYDSILNWGSLSALGLLLVFGAAVLERHRAWVVHRLLRGQLERVVGATSG